MWQDAARTSGAVSSVRMGLNSGAFSKMKHFSGSHFYQSFLLVMGEATYILTCQIEKLIASPFTHRLTEYFLLSIMFYETIGHTRSKSYRNLVSSLYQLVTEIEINYLS